MKVPRDLDIFWPSTVRKPWAEHRARGAKVRAVEHGRPEQRVEIDDVLADEVVELGVRIRTPRSRRTPGPRCGRTGSGSWPCSRSGRPARRRNTSPGDPGSRSRSRGRRGRCPTPAGRRRTTRRACWRPPSAGAPPRVQLLEHVLEVPEPEEDSARIRGPRAWRRTRRSRDSSARRRVAGAADLAVVPVLVRAPHLGHSPLMKRSGRNICSTGS